VFRVKTFHALGREILADGSEAVDPLLDRELVLRDMWPEIDRGTIRRLDDAFKQAQTRHRGNTARGGAGPGARNRSRVHSWHTNRHWRMRADSTSTTSWREPFGC